MPAQTLDYPGALSKLVGLIGDQIEVALRGSGAETPLVAYWQGRLQAGTDADGGGVAGWDRDAFVLYVGDVQLTIHPDRFGGAVWSEDGPRQLILEIGNVQMHFRERG